MKLDHKWVTHLPHIQQFMSLPSTVSYCLRTFITPLSSSVLCIGGLFEDKLLVESHRDLLRFVKISIGSELVNVFSGIVVIVIQHSLVDWHSFKLSSDGRSDSCVLRKIKNTTRNSTIPLKCTRSNDES